MAKILVFGDSIAWGAFDLEKGGWVERLKVYFLKKASKTMSSEDFYLYNFGMESDTSNGIFYRFEKQIEIAEKIEPTKKHVLIFAIGINDSADYKNERGVLKEKFEKNINLIINKAKKITNKIFFIGLTNVDEAKTNPTSFDKDLYYYNKNLKEYDRVIEKICKEENLNFISFQGLLSKEDLHDGLHPNAKGHKKIFERVRNVLDDKLGIGNN